LAYIPFMLTLAQLLDTFRTENDAYAYVVKLRWPNGVTCPKCGTEKVYRLNGGKGWKWVCKQSHAKNGYRFSPLVGTIFENTNIPLRTWFQCILLMCRSKKGMSALQIQHTLGLGSYRSAWYMCHRIRAAMENTDFTKLRVVSEDVSLIASDEHSGYSRLKASGYPHRTVTHRDGEYVRGNIHTANLDSFWALLKRGIMGNYHVVSKKYLPFYLAEFTFRHNHRTDKDLFASVLAAC
jgi:transposase-like protein